MIIFSSDNGPVLDDGYEDEAVSKLNGHTPGGVLRGGKYSTFEGNKNTNDYQLAFLKLKTAYPKRCCRKLILWLFQNAQKSSP